MVKIATITSGHIPSRWAHSINFVRQAYAFKVAECDTIIYSVVREYEANMMADMDMSALYGVGELDVVFEKEPGWQYYIERKWIQKLFYGFQKLTKYRFYPLSPGSVQLAEKVIQAKPDIAHGRSFDVVPALVKAGVPTVLETHGLNIHHRRPVFKQILALADQQAMKAIVVPSQPVADAWEALGFPKAKLFVLPNGVDLTRYEPQKLAGKRAEIREKLGWGMDDFVAGYTGYLNTGRGIEDIIEAARRSSEIKFMIVGGSEEDIARYTAMCEGLYNIVFTGFVPNGDVPFYTEAADALLMPYTRETTTWREMSPVKLYEYLAAGRPIISTDLPNLQEMLAAEKEALFVPENDGNAISEALERLKARPELVTEIAENNTRRAEQHSQVARAKALIQIGLGE